MQFTASKGLERVSLSLSPTLSNLAQLSTTSIKEIDKGKVVKLTLRLAPNATAPLSVIQGYVQLAAKEPAVTSQLPITVIVATGAIGTLPTDPGEAGKATLAGIDSDNDGVRDDIERYIWLTYPQSEKVRRSLFAVAREFQPALLSAATGDATSTARGYLATANAIDCVWYVRTNDAVDIRRALFAQYLNTKVRSLAYASYTQILSGQSRTVSGNFKQGCSGFDPDSLPN
ncbi:MAG: hypothetical protein JSR75_16705 [Proteobacteria bacterium]|nr:hypothetical protein [Pseudomonadota bacterium]